MTAYIKIEDEIKNSEPYTSSIHDRSKRKLELKACPFCGSKELNGPHCTEYCGDNYYDPSWWIECENCPCELRVYGKTVEGLLLAWNARVFD